MEIYNFCTLFDRNYLYKGLALYNSLLKVCESFKLWILCFDDITYNLLEKMKLRNIQLIPLKEFEDRDLIEAKRTRTPMEYFWTCTPSLPLYILKKEPALDMITYLDADLFFYSSPLPIYEELREKSILITKHGRAKRYEKDEKKFGIYNVQFLVFRNDANAIGCLTWWRNKCIEWCYCKCQDGKFGHQKYLDDWTERFKGVHVLAHKGGGVAPWNIENYSITCVNNKIFIDEQELIFYHVHKFNILSPIKFILTYGYNTLSEDIIKFIYKPYIYAISEAIVLVSKYEPAFRYRYDTEYFGRASSIVGIIKNEIKQHKIIKNIIRRYLGKFFGRNYYLYQIKNTA